MRADDAVMEALGKEIDAARTAHADYPVRIRVTKASLKGSLLLMPEENSMVTMVLGDVEQGPVRREIRMHPDDWEIVKRFAAVEEPLGPPTAMFGIPVLIEQDQPQPKEHP